MNAEDTFNVQVAPMRQDKLGVLLGSKVYAGRTDRRSLFFDAVGIDALEGVGVDIVGDLQDFNTWDQVARWCKNTKIPWHIECLSVLEHATKPWQLAEQITWASRCGTTLHISVPMVWRLHGYPNDYWRFTPEGVRLLFPGWRWESMMIACGDRLVETSEAKHLFIAPRVEGGVPAFLRCQVVGRATRVP